MPRGRRQNPPVPRPRAREDEMVLQRLRDDPTVDSMNPPALSPEVAALIDHNRDHIDTLARVSAIQGMPIILARGEGVTLERATKRLIGTIEGVIRQALDNGAGNAQDNCGIFSVEVYMSRAVSIEATDHTKGEPVLDIDVTIPLENAVLSLPPKPSAKLKKRFADWLGD